MRVQSAWCRETSSDPGGWSDANPGHGQCAVTALVVQDLVGGSLMRCLVGGVSHYWNLLDDGTEVDLTRGQFSAHELGEATGSVERSRDYVLGFTETRRRYDLLRQRVGW